ncbi:16S rRNA (guanine(527)-N(7))-methyltransferase RsmG [Actinotalea sp.]|uniref:16S rRNA (guanine(527)-N(7))-methyltransferase RsmG n=1 Tax=Actinotalea sp. TaxID=1872145 RepID=UPI002D1FA339|nr:16S rRNA (guanine(527)-N(7))-methyltransferase RsmG [Actinotalea sp.]
MVDEIELERSADDPEVMEFLGGAHATIARFASMLADEGVTRGLIGPREVPRLWSRHLLNSAAVASFLPPSGTVVDIGSGAGLPGVVLAALRPDLDVVLVEPMERRTVWLRHVVESLGLPRVEVVRGRAEDLVGRWGADVVTARAVAPLDRLVPWTLPLLRTGGVLLAMKGDRAVEEVAAAQAVIASHGGGDVQVISAPSIPGCGTTVVRVRRVGPIPSAPRRAKRR